ncbi:MAG: hypothetical protein SVU32_03560, partial [Candidatus Nanohaloarchaea archaeon]|nr:hypothetical protein [Candidatus Nanohaloarchaea archaeon]
LRAFFRKDRDIHIEDALDRFDEEHDNLFDLADERSDEFRESIDDLLETLDEELERLVAYSDPEDRAVIEDVTTNLGEDRQDLVDGFEVQQSLDELRADLEDLVDDFQTMTQKEKKVLEQVPQEAKQAFSTLRDLKDRQEELVSFIEDRYSTVTARDDLEDLLQGRKDVIETIEELQAEIEGLDFDGIEERIAEKQQELEDHRGKELWDEREQLVEEIEEHRQRIQRERSRIQRALGKMERGLKKLVYQAENGDVALDDTTLATLKDLQDGEVGATEQVEEAAEAARAAVQEHSILDSADRFLDGIEELEQLGSIRSTVETLEQELDSMQDDLDDFDLEAVEQELEDELEELQAERQKLEDREGELRDRIQELEQEIEEYEERIEELLDDHLSGAVTLRTGD